MRMKRPALTSLAILTACVAAPYGLCAQTLTGREAMGDWRTDRPGVTRLITTKDLPAPGATPSAVNFGRIVPRPASARLQVPDGFEVNLFAEDLRSPRIIRVAPNGDVFAAETSANLIRVLRAGSDGKATVNEIYATGLSRPFGIAFHPRNNPQWVYVANTDSVVRFPYREGDLKASGRPETMVSRLPAGSGHSTRDIVFSNDGQRMFVSVGSAGNAGEGMGQPEDGIAAWQAKNPLGASWGRETNRAVVLAFDPDGKNQKTFATGVRNCVGLAVHPRTGDLWCSTNERDGLGEDLVPDYVTRVREGEFYGWPWYYLGDNEDPRHRGARPDLRGKIAIPDVLIQSHSAPLGMVFYDGTQFPSDYHGDAFAAAQGSWNRAKRVGQKIVRIKLRDGVPTGEYQDFATGFILNDTDGWGRPVGLAIAKDGALLLSDDGNGTIWRVSYRQH